MLANKMRKTSRYKIFWDNVKKSKTISFLMIVFQTLAHFQLN